MLEVVKDLAKIAAIIAQIVYCQKRQSVAGLSVDLTLLTLTGSILSLIYSFNGLFIPVFRHQYYKRYRRNDMPDVGWAKLLSMLFMTCASLYLSMSFRIFRSTRLRNQRASVIFKGLAWILAFVVFLMICLIVGFGGAKGGLGYFSLVWLDLLNVLRFASQICLCWFIFPQLSVNWELQDCQGVWSPYIHLNLLGAILNICMQDNIIQPFSTFVEQVCIVVMSIIWYYQKYIVYKPSSTDDTNSTQLLPLNNRQEIPS